MFEKYFEQRNIYTRKESAHSTPFRHPSNLLRRLQKALGLKNVYINRSERSLIRKILLVETIGGTKAGDGGIRDRGLLVHPSKLSNVLFSVVA